MALPFADFTFANLKGAVAETAVFRHAKFDYSNLDGALFREADVDQATFVGARGMENANFAMATGTIAAMGAGRGV